MADSICEIPVIRGYPPASGSFAKQSLLSNRLTVKFDTVNQEILFQGILPDKFLGGNLVCKLYWIMPTHTGGTVTFEVSYLRIGEGSDYTNTSFSATKTITTSSTGSGQLCIDSCTFTNIELGYSANTLNELFRIKIKATAFPSAINLLNIVFENP